MTEQINSRQVVVFTLSGEQYPLPIQQIQEIIRYTPPRSISSREESVRGILSLRGRIVPLVGRGFSVLSGGRCSVDRWPCVPSGRAP
jgi:chemotaxis signal transduction protein